jgi:glycopeptide antibiotics resistance protein
MKKYFLPLGASALVLYLHLIGMEHFLYWRFWWYDVLLHFLGGVAITSFLFIFTQSWKKALAGLFLIAIGWEIFEYVLHIAVRAGDDYTLDTIKDLIMDTIGAGAAIYINKK